MPAWADKLYNAQKAKQAGDSKPARKGRGRKDRDIIRQPEREPNSTERAFESAYLRPWLLIGEITNYRFEKLRLYLANGHSYRPEWCATRPDGTLAFFEIKGARPRQREAGISQVKVAATLFPEFEFWICKLDHGAWTIQQVKP